MRTTLCSSFMNSFLQLKVSKFPLRLFFSTKSLVPWSNLHSLSNLGWRQSKLKYSHLAWPFTYSCLNITIRFSNSMPAAAAIIHSISSTLLLSLVVTTIKEKLDRSEKLYSVFSSKTCTFRNMVDSSKSLNSVPLSISS